LVRNSCYACIDEIRLEGTCVRSGGIENYRGMFNSTASCISLTPQLHASYAHAETRRLHRRRPVRSVPPNQKLLELSLESRAITPICIAMAANCDEIERDRLVKEVVLSRIPAFPPVVLRALDLLSSDRVEIADLVREITSDATLSAHVLRMANSALFGFQAQVDTVRHAVVALGISRVQSIVMTVATSNFIRAALRTDALVKCWRHSLASAFISQELARSTGLPADRAYSVGLLHDIGRLGLLVGYPDAYSALISEANRNSLSLLDLEKRQFGMDHCEAGRILTEQWGLPGEFCLATGRHHDPPQGAPFDMLRVVHLSCQFADTLGYSAVTPLNPISYETLQESLPPYTRGRIPESAEAFARLIASSMGDNENDLELNPAKISGATLERGLAQAPEAQIDLATFRPQAHTPMVNRRIKLGHLIVLITMVFITVTLILSYLVNAR
jgi:HD-like signal output (HDOD) protein